MEYLIPILCFGVVAFKFWIDDRKEKRYDERLGDLLNRKMSRDFYDYVNGTEVLRKAKDPEQLLLEGIERQIQDKRDQGRVPNMINQQRAVSEIPLKSNRTY